MNCTELPKDWAQRPMTDADLFEGVIDLVVTGRSRTAGAVHVLLCHAGGRLLQQVVLDNPVWGEPRERIVRAFAGLFAGLAEQGVAGAVIVLARPGGRAPTGSDETYGEAIRTAARDAGFCLFGMAVASPSGVMALPGWREAFPAPHGSVPGRRLPA